MTEITPRTPREVALYRARLSCKCGEELLDVRDENITLVTVAKAMFCILRALDDITVAIENQDEP